MGSTLTTMMLLVGSLITGTMSSAAADGARKRDWSKAKIFSGVSMGTAIVLFALALYLIIRHHMWSGPGVMIALVLLILSTIGVAVLDTIALIGAASDKPENSRAFGMSVGAAILSFGSFILSLVIIIFLL